MTWGWMSMVLEDILPTRFCSSLRRGSELRPHLWPDPAPMRSRRTLRRYPFVEATVHLAGIALEDLALVLGSKPRHLVDAAVGVVIIMPGARIDALYGADHFRGEQDVVGRDHRGEQLDAGQMIDAGIEIDVPEQMLFQRRPLQILGDAAIAAPMIRHRAAAMRNDQLQGRKILEQVRGDELHEGGGVAVDVVRAGGVEIRVARGADMDHCRHVELDQFFVKRIPPAVGERRRVPVAARRIGIEIAADETKLVDAAREFADAILRIDAGRLRQLAHADEIVGIEGGEAVNQVVRNLRPFEAHAFVADVMRHAGRARREDGEAGAALALELELGAPDARAQLVVADLDGGWRGLLRRVLDGGDLVLAEIVQLLRLGGVVAVAIDDHDASLVRDGRWP